MKNKIVTLILAMFLISFATASSLGTFQQDTCVQLYQTCDDCTYVNLTNVIYPNSTSENINKQMTKKGVDYNYSFCSTSALGDYSYNTCGDKDSGFECEKIDFIITKTGKDLKLGESIIYVLLTLAVFGLFLLSLYATIVTPYSNKINERGAVIKITKLKYVKLGLILLSYSLFVWLLNVLIGVSDNFVTLTMYYGLLSFLFLTLNNLALPISIFILVLSGFEVIRDINVHKIIKKFGDAR